MLNYLEKSTQRSGRVMPAKVVISLTSGLISAVNTAAKAVHSIFHAGGQLRA